MPILFGHFLRGGRKPLYVVGAIVLLAGKPVVGRDLRKAVAQSRHLADESGQIVVAAELRPVDPAGFIVLAIGIVVAALTVGNLVTREQQRNAARQKQTGNLIPPQLPAAAPDIGVVGRALDTAIDADIVVGAVAVVFAIGLVVLVFVADQIGEGKTVMHRHMIDAGARAAAVVLELHGRGGHSLG